MALIRWLNTKKSDLNYRGIRHNYLQKGRTVWTENVCVCAMYELFSPSFFFSNVTSVLRSEVSLCERAWAGELDLSVSLSFCVVTTLLSVVASVVWTDTGRTSCIYVCVCMWIYTFHYRIKLYIQLVPRQWWHISWTLCTCNISE